MSINATVFQADVFNIFILISYAMYFLLLIGVVSRAPTYLNTLDFFAKLYVCAFLIYRFNPMRKRVTCNFLDRKVAFTAGIFLLTVAISNSLAIRYIVNKTKSTVAKTITNIKNKIITSTEKQEQIS